MKHIADEPMVVVCSNCNATSSTNDLTDFKESNTYPPTAYFMCSSCEQMSELSANDMPKRLFATLVNKIAKERGYSDRAYFDKLQPVV